MVERHFFEGLILAQDERWRRALSMQVERVLSCRKASLELVANGWVMNKNLSFGGEYLIERWANTA